MAVYQLIDRLSRDPDSRDKWIIERAVPRSLPIRLMFQGTRKQAQSEVARLNAFLQKKTDDLRTGDARTVPTSADALTAGAWGEPGSRMPTLADGDVFRTGR